MPVVVLRMLLLGYPSGRSSGTKVRGRVEVTSREQGWASIEDDSLELLRGGEEFNLFLPCVFLSSHP